MKKPENEKFTEPALRALPPLAGIAALAIAVTGCGKASSTGATSTGTATALAVGAVGGAVTSTSGDTISALMKRQDTLFASLLRDASPISTAFASAFGTCPTAEHGNSGSCSVLSNSMILSFPSGGCTYGGGTGPIWLGGTMLTTAAGNNPPACGTYPYINGSTITSVTRTYTGNLLASPTSRTNEPGTQTVVIDTSAPTASAFASAKSASPASGTIGWEYSIPAGGGYERTYVSSSTHNLDITARIIGYSGSSPSGTVDFDHTLSTTDSSGNSTPLDITLSGSGSSLTQTVNGTLHLQHNLIKITGSAEFNDVVFEVGCCYPVSGTVTTTFTGGPNNGKQESMTFSDATCSLDTMGQVEFTGVNGATNTYQLTHCL